MENWIGVGVWIVLGVLMGMAMKVVVKLPQETAGHATILGTLGAFGAVIGGMLGVGLFHLYEPLALSVGGMAGAVLLSALVTWIYRVGTRGLI